ncbi:PREDICTED: uncharacterized protein LOC108747659 [Trachymyrmex septentrionalis]|uniref:uncharacterized protein LOC108747659 n=1 Tax=Trachymyrmex septentrionalis TaxID=34720 RepID=UPI00084F6AA6|nr:PREDICTED: uncharacterized protein LOC108747659 [Trachymyrmex septentrionalis]
MKTIVILLVVSFVAVLGFGVTEEERAKWEQIEKDCIAESGVDLAVYQKKEKPDENDEILACYISCIYKKSGILKEDGKIDWDKLRANMSKHEPQEKIDEIYNKCKDVDGEGCQKAKNFMKCIDDVGRDQMH